MSLNIVITYFSRFLGLILSIFIIKIFIAELSIPEYAHLALLLSFSPWIALLNFGMPTVLQNKIALKRSLEEDYISLIKVAHDITKMILMFSLMISIILYFFHFNHSNLLFSILIIITLVLNSIIQIYTSFSYGIHKNVFPNHMPLLNNVLIIFFYYVFKNFCTGSLAVAFSQLLPSFIIFIIYLLVLPNTRYLFTRIQFVNFKLYGNEVFSMLKIIILSNFVTALDFYFINKFADSIMVFNYSILNRIFTLALTFQSILLVNYWTRLSDLFYLNKFANFRKLVKNLVLISTISVFMLFLFYLFFEKEVLKFLTSSKVDSIAFKFELIVFCLFVVRLISNVYASSLQAIGMFKDFLLYISIQATLALILQYFLGFYFSVWGVLIGILLSYLMTAIWYLPKQVYKHVTHVA